MKRVDTFIYLLLCLFPLLGSAQNRFEKGFIVTLNGDKFEGSIKKYFNSSGTIVFLNVENKRKSYSPSSLKRFSVANANYISYCYDFYEVILVGEKATLYRKVTNNRDKFIYNGAQIGGFVKTTEGNIGEYYIKVGTGLKLDVITRTNFNEYFLTLMQDNDALTAKIRSGSLGYSEIKTVVELYND
jgi:hypothetical protein